MAIYLGGTPIGDIRIGSTLVQSVWIGATKIWQRATVSISGEIVYHLSGGTTTAGVRFNPNGTVQQRLGTTYTQIDAGSDWIRPVSAASGDYQIRASKTSGSNPDTTLSDPLDTWLDLDAARQWAVRRYSAGDITSTLSIEIRLSGTTLASGTYTLTAEMLEFPA